MIHSKRSPNQTAKAYNGSPNLKLCAFYDAWHPKSDWTNLELKSNSFWKLGDFHYLPGLFKKNRV